MHDPFHKLRETGWRRKLTPEEAAEADNLLSANPPARADWEAEVALSRQLTRLPDAPVPSNFTARVLRAVELEKTRAHQVPRSGWQWLWHSLVPKTAFAALVVGMVFFSYHEARALKRAQLARSVATVSGVTSLPSPELLKDFDVIQGLNSTPPPDTELLALLK